MSLCFSLTWDSVSRNGRRQGFMVAWVCIPPPLRKNSPSAAQLKIVFRRFLFFSRFVERTLSRGKTYVLFPREPIRFLYLPQKTAFFNGFLPRCLGKNRCWDSRFHVKIYISNRKILRQNFELVCWARCRKDISPKFVLFLACNRTVGYSWTVNEILGQD